MGVYFCLWLVQQNQPAACGIRLQCKQLTDCLTRCKHHLNLFFPFFFHERKGETGAESFSVLSGYSDLASDVVDFRVQKDCKSLVLILIGGLYVCTY
jgi:hypothetical protein